jgi:DNA polymerase elongation subunit (family B)
MKRILVLDLECYPNYFLAQFKSLDTRKVQSFEMFEGQALDRASILGILKTFTIVTFNGNDYDMPMLTYALVGADNAMLKEASDNIIVSGLRGWQFYDAYNIRQFSGIDHIDLKEPVPGPMVGLKQYGGRIHSKRLQDLPYPPDQPLDVFQMLNVKAYCENDLDITIDLWTKARDPKDDIIGTREALTKQYGIDVRSKSDAQVAEAIIRAEVEKLKGERIYRADVQPGTTFKYKPPAWLQFQTPLLRQVFAEICAATFMVKMDGKVSDPPALAREITIGRSTYSMGIGGLHSTEKRAAHRASRLVLLRDRDVVSYYPSLIIQCGLSPENMGVHFQTVYRGFRDQRVTAKKSGNKSLAQTLKIFLNGTFGKTASRYSVLYAPHLLIQVTVTGQLALLMMIEHMELAGIPCVSANTDGVVMACPAAKEAEMLRIVQWWERQTGFETEETKYRALFSRDVNNYIALKEGGGYKTKGVMADPGFMKNPANVIVNEAVALQLDKGIPFAETILKCGDIRKFLTVKRVSGGAVFQEKYLGKVVRWYRSTNSSDSIFYGPGKKQGHKVGGSDNAMPLMDLPDAFPTDIDYAFYINEARDLLREIGALE